MSVIKVIVCDGCKVKRAAGATARAARGHFVLMHGGMTFVQPGSRDFCGECVEAGKHQLATITLRRPKRVSA